MRVMFLMVIFLTSSGDPSDMFATRFGKGERTLLLSRLILPSAGTASTELLS